MATTADDPGVSWLYVMLRRMSARELDANRARALQLFDRLPPAHQADLRARSPLWAGATCPAWAGAA